jgi:hypothetical protein
MRPLKSDIKTGDKITIMRGTHCNSEMYFSINKDGNGSYGPVR